MFGMSIEQQFRLFLYLCILGLTSGLFFDFFKAWGKTFNFSRRAIFLVDLSLCIFLSLVLFYLLLHTNQGEVRLYSFMALLAGIILYFGFASPYLFRGFLIFFQKVKIGRGKLVKTIPSWQELANRKRTVYRSFNDRWKRFFRKED